MYLSAALMGEAWPDNKTVVIRRAEAVFASNDRVSMETCTHEEADTRMVVHTLDALRSGLTLCCIRTVDTGVVVILLGKLGDILTLHPEAKMWVAFGSGIELISILI